MDSHQTKSISEDDFLAARASKNQTDDNAAILPIELTNSTGTRLETLNDDCLLEIFSCNSLTLFDLCSLAETCTRFKQITQHVFPKDYGIVCGVQGFGFGCQFRSRNCEWYITMKTVERSLKNFGPHLSELFITGDYQNILNLVGKYCGDATVKNLDIHRIENLDDIIKPLDSIFQRVQKLTIDRCNFIRYVPNCSSLIELKISRSRGCGDIMECTFPHLQHFTWTFSYMYANGSVRYCDILHKFIRQHVHLKSIRISVCCNDLLNVIDDNCRELEDLILNSMNEYRPSRRRSTPGSLSKLKILEFDYMRRRSSPLEYIPLLKVAKTLEIMKISRSFNYEFPVQIFDVLSQLEHLREFHLSFGSVGRIPWTKLTQLRKVKLEFCRCYRRDITNMIEKLINLEELELNGSGSRLSEDDFLEICEIVERREHVLTIKCNLSLELKECCDDNGRVKLINV